jgi:hypothetical protein
MDAQEKNMYGNIDLGGHVLNRDMRRYAGKIFTIRIVFNGGSYDLGLPESVWEDWMFDPDYKPDEPLSAEDAIRAMLDGEVLQKIWI